MSEQPIVNSPDVEVAETTEDRLLAATKATVRAARAAAEAAAEAAWAEARAAAAKKAVKTTGGANA